MMMLMMTLGLIWLSSNDDGDDDHHDDNGDDHDVDDDPGSHLTLQQGEAGRCEHLLSAVAVHSVELASMSRSQMISSSQA